ncbi:DUF6376 family protein [Lentibacillus sediminis]|uniref:DUF6376 family protein n=1 Tax=Lentibacillus sediminis TaxID=1940529 RepID=UPI000C1C477A|nr:DUF6376 family protein [Lentibacillus sediminis]
MKMRLTIFLTVAMLTLSGCSLLEETNNTLNYATEATEYMNELSTFAEESSSLINEAAQSEEAQAELADRLSELEQTAEEFNNIEVPSIAEGIHESLMEQNQQLLEITNNVVENGEVALDQLRESEIYQTIENITELRNQIEQLGFEE